MEIKFFGTEVVLVDDVEKKIDESTTAHQNIMRTGKQIRNKDLSSVINTIKSIGTKIIEEEIENQSTSPERIILEFSINVDSEGVVSIADYSKSGHFKVSISW